MGALDCIFNLCVLGSTTRRRRSTQTTDIKVKMDCDGCERKVKNAVKNLRGVERVEIDRKQSRVKVTGLVDPTRVLNSVKKTGKRAELWPYIPHTAVQLPHAPQVYDIRAPPGYVRNLQTNSEDTSFTFLFSDDNPNACSIM